MRFIAVSVCALTLTACAVGPNYKRPSAPIPEAFKEAEGWKLGAPQDGVARGPWWDVYNDPILNGLVSQVALNNQNVLTFEAQYREALAILRESRATLFPTLSGSASVTRAERGSVSSTPLALGPGNTYSVGVDGSWDIDIWGRIRRTIESNRASAQAGAADLANATLLAQSQLATAYFQLRVQDELKRLLDETCVGYAESLRLTQNKYQQGVSSKADVAQAQTQLLSAQAQAINTLLQRQQLEHAIAVLMGKPPSAFSIAPVSEPYKLSTPGIPLTVPSTLLERRPDVAASERLVASANAQIGVAIAAFFPDLTLSGAYGYSASSLGTLFAVANRVWSVGPALAVTLFDAGAHSAQVQHARAAYDAQVATYRQTVLSAFQQVEDELTAVKVLGDQSGIQEQAVSAALEAQRIARNEYKAGTVDFTTVATAQAAALTAEQTELSVQENQLIASVTLIQALGGSWSTADIPKK